MPAEKCNNCLVSGKIRLNWRSGDKTCTNCGIVLEERMVVDDVLEYREFSGCGEDAKECESRRRVGEVFSIFGPSVLAHGTTKTDDKLFLDKGKQLLDDFFTTHFVGCRDKSVESRAHEIYEQAYMKQRAEKSQSSPETKRRLKFSRRKTYLTAAIWMAFMESGASRNRWSVKQIAQHFQVPLTEEVVKRALRDVGYELHRIRKQHDPQARSRRKARAELQRRINRGLALVHGSPRTTAASSASTAASSASTAASPASATCGSGSLAASAIIESWTSASPDCSAASKSS